MATIEEKIYSKLYSEIKNHYGVAGLMGNLYAESALKPNNLEDLCELRLKQNGYSYCTDEKYTAAVDNGTISRAKFLNPLPGCQYGYGLAQWTSPGRKGGLYDLVKSKKVSIADTDAQVEFLIKELKTSYSSTLSVLKSAKSIAEASDYVLVHFECPADTGSGVRATRQKYSKVYYDKYSKSETTKLTATQAIDLLISIAADEVGYLEKASGYNLYDKTANAGFNNYTKYGYEMHQILPAVMDYPAYWCDCFVDWCFYKAFGIDKARKLLCGEFDDYTVNSAGYFKNKGRWHTSGPKRGDQVFFKDPGICHTGIVYKVDASYIYTIEGNTSGSSGLEPNGGCVAYKKHAIGTSYIAGYGRPDYEGIVAGTTVNVSVNTSTNTPVIAPSTTTVKNYISLGDTGYQVKELQQSLTVLGFKGLNNTTLDSDGIFGNNTLCAVKAFQKKYGLEVDGCAGPITLAKIKELVNAKKNTATSVLQPATAFDKNIASKYTVDADALYLRYGPGTEFGPMAIMPGGSAVYNYGYYSVASTGVKWYYVVYNEFIGFCSSEYLA